MQETLTILFTDAVASTEALARLGDERFEQVQAAHLDLLRAPIESGQGREVKSLGDGLMVSFSGAADALACAVAMQQAIEAAARQGEEGLPLRVGVSAGDVSIDEGDDLHGTAVVEAARLCAAASGGQVLATGTVRVLAGTRGGHAFNSLGPLELKGLPDPVPVVEVGWAPLATGDELPPIPLPPRLALESAWDFVGRGGEIERLEALWREAAAGSRRVALLGGEPGAGKTRLARELAIGAHQQGALVLFGRVDEDIAVAYQPFAEALRQYLGHVDEETRERVLTRRGRALARLVPELVEEPPEGHVDALTVFDALVDWLADEAARRPVLLVLDDLHWAPRPTLLALMHLVRSQRLDRLLIVGTYRDTELGRQHPLSEILADLRREEGVERLVVRGLGPEGVMDFVEAARGDQLDEQGRELARRLGEQTQGNPFFVGQVLRHLAESGAIEEVDGRWVAASEGAELELPEGVREVVGRRVSRLSKTAGELLSVAAVAGPEFDTAVVAEAAGHATAEALDAYDEATSERLLLETAVPGRLRFAHAVVRQTLEEELSTLRRLHLHQQIGLALEQRFGAADSAVAELAHHFAEAATLGEGERAAGYAERAAEQALDRGAPSQAAELLERALELLPSDEADRDGNRRDRLFALLCNCLIAVYDQGRMEEIARQWLALADERKSYGMRVQASWWLLNSWPLRKVPGPDDLAEITRTLDIDLDSVQIGDRRRLSLAGGGWSEDDAAGLRANLLSVIAWTWSFGLPMGELGDQLPGRDPIELAEEALRLASASVFPDATNNAELNLGITLMASPDVDKMRRSGERLTAVSYPVGGGGWLQVLLARIRLGRLDEVAGLSDEALRFADQSGDRVAEAFAWAARSNVAMIRGQLEEARIAADRQLATNPEAPTFQMISALLGIGRQLAEGRPEAARPAAEALAALPALDNSALLGAVAAAEGDLKTAGSVLATWHENGHLLPLNFVLAARLWGLATCAHAVGDGDAAARLYDPLLPWDGQILSQGWSISPASAAYTLGLLAETMGERDRALGHYSDALAFEQEIGAKPFAARTREALNRVE